MSLLTQYEDKAANYYAIARQDLVKLVPENSQQRILEIGASGGYTLLTLKLQGKASYVAGVELFSLPNTEQQNPLIDFFLVADIESEVLPFQKESFDVIILGDVLEHLKDPWEIYKNVVTFLKPGGLAIVSVPNIRFIKVLFTILFKGNFRYTDSDILDRTHLRFFCKKNIIDLVNQGGTSVVKCYPSFQLQKQWKLKLINTLSFGLFEQLVTVQNIIVAKK